MDGFSTRIRIGLSSRIELLDGAENTSNLQAFRVGFSYTWDYMARIFLTGSKSEN